MKVDFLNKSTASCELSETEARVCVEKIFFALSKDVSNTSCEIILVDQDEMRDINYKFRTIKKTTDVLSFPQIKIDGIPENNIGTIIICPQVAMKTNQKCNDLLIHGVMHLLGYDHEIDHEDWINVEKKIKDYYELQKI